MKDCAIAALFSPDKKQILLVKRRDVPLWVLPGGGIEDGEDPRDAAVREFYEETGVKVAIQRHIGEYEPINRLSAPTYFFECIPLEDTLCLRENAESRAIRFFPVDALPSTLFFLHRNWISEALSNHPEPLRRKLTEITYVALGKFLFQHPILFFRAALARLGLPINSG